MRTSNQKTIGTIKSKIGFMEIVVFGFFTILLVVSVIQFIDNDFNSEWIYIILLILTFCGLLLVFINYKNKTILFTKDSITIKRPFGFYTKTYLKDELKGYDLQEFYATDIGLTRQIRLWTKDNKKIVFVRDAYSDYRQIQRELKKNEFQFLGTVELKSEQKRLMGTVARWTLIIAMVMFVLLGILKVMVNLHRQQCACAIALVQCCIVVLVS